MTAKVDEQYILDRLFDRLEEDPRVDAAQVGLEVSHHGSVTLRGTVRDFTARRAAEDDARETKGVHKVYNYLAVSLPEPVSPDKAGVEGEDAVLLRINNDLQGERVLESEKIEVRLEDGKAILEGSVNAYWKRNRAGAVALADDGVSEVVNHLTVVPTNLKDDEEIAAQIMEALAENCHIDEEAVDVKVNKALVTLRGTVPSEKARHEAFQAALYAEGVADVRDELKIAPSAE